jgi:hypothetical protein
MPGRRSTVAGMRVIVRSGPREGCAGTVVKLKNGQQYLVRFDDGTERTVLRRIAQPLSGPAPAARPEPRTRGGSPADRVRELFEQYPQLQRVVVYVTAAGRTFVAPWREQDVGPGLVGVYSRGVDPRMVMEDLR